MGEEGPTHLVVLLGPCVGLGLERGGGGGLIFLLSSRLVSWSGGSWLFPGSLLSQLWREMRGRVQTDG